MHKKVLTRDDLVSKTGLVVIIVFGLFMLGAVMFTSFRDGFDMSFLPMTFIIVALFGGLTVAMVKTNKNAKDGQFVIYIDTLVDKRRRSSGTREHRSTKYEFLFNDTRKIRPSFGGWISVDSQLFHDVEIGDKCYVIFIGTENFYSTKVFSTRYYELSEDLKGMVRKYENKE